MSLLLDRTLGELIWSTLAEGQARAARSPRHTAPSIPGVGGVLVSWDSHLSERVEAPTDSPPWTLKGHHGCILIENKRKPWVWTFNQM